MLFESDSQRFHRCLGCITLTPRPWCKSPTNLNTWSKCGCKRCSSQTREASKDTFNLYCPQTETILQMTLRNSLNESGTFVMGHDRWEISHDLRVCTHLRERFDVCLCPFAHQQSLGAVHVYPRRVMRSASASRILVSVTPDTTSRPVDESRTKVIESIAFLSRPISMMS